VNSTASVRDTYYTRSQVTDPVTSETTMLDDPINRRILTVQSQIVGPVFNRIWDTPGNGFAEKFKHSIEPYVNVQYTTSVNNFDKIVQFDGIDSYVGGAQYTYGVNNRFYAKRKSTPGAPSQAREILDVELTQTYYTNQLASQYDRQYQFNGFVNSAPSNFSPIALNIRAIPTNDLNANVRAEFDSRYHALRTISANTSYSWAGRVQTTVGWSKKSLIPELAGFNDPAFLDHYINTSTTLRTKDNHIGGVYSNNYDVLHSTMTNSRISAFYNSQCCGIAFEYQTYNYGAGSSIPIPSDHRFFLSFTLAGLGNFSPFNGAMSGVPH
jgi:hypothetical protein